MPLSSPSARRVLAALVTVLLLAAPALVSSPASMSWTLGAASAAPPAQDGADVELDLVSLTPTSLAAGGTLRAEVAVTNTSSRALPAPRLDLRTRTARVTDRTVIADWEAATEPDTTGGAVASSAPGTDLAPGESITLAVEVAAAELGYVDEPYFWGTRRISLTVVSGEEPLSSLRTFVVWRPDGADDAITQSVLLPVASLDASAPITAPEAYAEAAGSGRIADLIELAGRPDVDWWLDPALLDAPRVPAGTVGADGSPIRSEDPTGPEDPDATAEPATSYEPHPLAERVAGDLEDRVGTRTVLSMPYAHVDTLALEQAGASALAGAAARAGEVVWDETGILPRTSALALDAEQADPAAISTLTASGTSTLILPSTSVREDPAGTVTPSSVGRYAADGDPAGAGVPLLAPDPELSSEFSLLTADADAERTRQRLLAETATIASEYTTAPRHLLIAPDPGVALDAEAAGLVLDSFEEAPWIRGGRTGALLDAARDGEWTTSTQDGSGRLFALGDLGPEEVHPAGPDAVGRWVHRDRAEPLPLTDPEVLRDLDASWQRLDTLGAAMEDDASLDGPRLTALSGASQRWRGMPGVPAERAREASAETEDLLSRIDVIPASGYNLISDSAGVPITITNDLDTPITVRPHVTSDRPLVRIGEQQDTVVPARGEADLTVPVDAIANGTVELTVSVTTADGRSLGAPVTVPLTVNPAWENWTTLVLVIAMGVLVVFGVARARRTGAATRAPGVQGPEDPVELSRTGISQPDRPDQGHPDAQQDHNAKQDQNATQNPDDQQEDPV